MLYTGFIFAGFNWMLKTQTKQINAQIEPIKELLSNHISDTNKKIDNLSNRISDTNKRIDQLSDRIDKQSDQFDKLYDFLMQKQINNT